MHWWDEDVTALSTEVDALKTGPCGSGGAVADKEAAISEFFARKKEEVTAITEVCLRVCQRNRMFNCLSATLACSPLYRMGEGPQCGS